MVKPSVRVPHKVGDKLFIDFTGKKLQVVDITTGEVQDVEVFVAVLGCSQYTYVKAVPTQKKRRPYRCLSVSPSFLRWRTGGNSAG
ncbi:MAG: hypothetical protein QM763_24785 [Agriterribacter sp.]